MTNNTPQPDIAKIRQLLLAAFTPEELRRFCYDRPTLRPIVDLFGPGFGAVDMVDRLIEYCDRRLLLDQLLSEVKQTNPGQYARFEPYELVSKPSLIRRPRIRRLPWYWMVGGLLLALIVGAVAVKLLFPVSTPAPEPTESGTRQMHTPTSMPGPPKCTFSGDTWTRPTDSMVMACVPEGEFRMGSRDADPGAYEIEKPVHMVYLDAFWMDKYEVSNTQYRRCVEAGVCDAPRCDQGSPTYGDASKADYPVQCVDWEEAKTYAAWAGGRLPTEAEWEKACRGTERQIYPWGNSAPDCSIANYSGCAGDGSSVNPVGSYPEGASPYGVQEMAGNLWEWVADWSVADYYANSPLINPQGPDSGEHRGIRGGSAYQDEEFLRCAARGGSTPYFHFTDTGFRVVMEPGP